MCQYNGNVYKTTKCKCSISINNSLKFEVLLIEKMILNINIYIIKYIEEEKCWGQDWWK